MKKSIKVQQIKREFVQSNIFTAMNNMKMLGDSQRLKKENLSSIVIEVHNSDSETEENSAVIRKTTTKRKLPFPLSDHDDSGNESDEKGKMAPGFTPSHPKMTRMLTVNRPNICSTPLKIEQSEDSLSSLNISSIKEEEIIPPEFLDATTRENSPIDRSNNSSDTILVENSQNDQIHLFTQFNKPILEITYGSEENVPQNLNNSSDTTLNKGSQFNTEKTEIVKNNNIYVRDITDLNETVKITPDNTFVVSINTSDELNSTRKINTDTDVTSEEVPSPVQNAKQNPKSSSKNTPKKRTKKELKTINTSYLTTLQELLASFQTYTDIDNLLSEEKDVLRIFISNDMDQNYQYVCLKLLTWKNKWHNIFKFFEKINLNLEKQEIMRLYKCLKENNVVDTDYTKEDLSYLLDLLDMNDVQMIYKKFKCKKANTKEERINNLLKYCSSQSTLISSSSIKDLLLTEIKQKMGNCIRLKKMFQDSFYNIFLLATFTNSAFSNINDYFTNIIGLKICLPTYTVEEYKMFHSRNEFLSFARAHKYDDDYENACLKKNHLGALQISEEIYKELVKLENISEDENRYKDAPHLKKFTAKSVYASTLSKAAKLLLTKYPLNVRTWLEYMIGKIKSHRIGEWYYHLTWIYMKYTKPPNYQYAATLIIKVLKYEKDKLTEIQLHNFRKRCEQLQSGKRYKLDQLTHDSISEFLPQPLEKFTTHMVDAKTLRGNESGQKRSYVKDDKNGNKSFMSVENIALDYYINSCSYTDGKHCEGSLVQALFVLFFWDIIYYPDPPVPGTFLSKIQQAPLDMKTQYFYTNRKHLIDIRLEQIASEWKRSLLLQFLKYSYENNSYISGIYNVNSVIPDTEADSLLETLVDCIGRKILSEIFRRLVKNPGAYRSGMPDLLIWNVDTKTAKFVEVKGEGDRLQPNQELWLSYLRSIGADIAVCHVHSIGSKRKKIQPSNDV